MPAVLQHLSGARVAATEWSAEVLSKSGLSKNDPQYGVIPPIALVANVQKLADGETVKIGQVSITAHLTPGHTPSGSSWTWQSCEANRCLDLIYADRLSPVSADGFKFTRSREYPNAIQDFCKSFSFLGTTPCDIPLTTHPDASSLWDRSAAREKSIKPDPMVDPAVCRRLADTFEASLQKGIVEENAP
jgi:metallo-beta-lactamase class B